jgi:hypothetical protein
VHKYGAYPTWPSHDLLKALRRPDLFDMEVIVRRQCRKRCASIADMIRHYVARRAQVIEDHPHNAESGALPATYRNADQRMHLHGSSACLESYRHCQIAAEYAPTIDADSAMAEQHRTASYGVRSYAATVLGVSRSLASALQLARLAVCLGGSSPGPRGSDHGMPPFDPAA